MLNHFQGKSTRLRIDLATLKEKRNDTIDGVITDEQVIDILTYGKVRDGVIMKYEEIENKDKS